MTGFEITICIALGIFFIWNIIQSSNINDLSVILTKNSSSNYQTYPTDSWKHEICSQYYTILIEQRQIREELKLLTSEKDTKCSKSR